VTANDLGRPVRSVDGDGASYDVNEDVSLVCSAADATSGIASTLGCGSVMSEAWTFGEGTHEFDASATDNAGNTSDAPASFTVTVSPEGLSDLVVELVGDEMGEDGVVSSLTANLRGKNPQPRAFINQVRALAGKKIPQDLATTSIALASEL